MEQNCSKPSAFARSSGRGLSLCAESLPPISVAFRVPHKETHAAQRIAKKSVKSRVLEALSAAGRELAVFAGHHLTLSATLMLVVPAVCAVLGIFIAAIIVCVPIYCLMGF